MKKKIFTILAFITACVFWLFEASLHYYIHGEPQFEMVPDNVNELWMRIVITFLIILFGLFADYFSNKIMMSQKQLEAARIYKSMASASHHIVNNLLNQVQLFRMVALESKDFDQDTIKLFDDSIAEASDLIDRLSKLEEVTEENILASVDPKNISDSSDNFNIVNENRLN